MAGAGNANKIFRKGIIFSSRVEFTLVEAISMPYEEVLNKIKLKWEDDNGTDDDDVDFDNDEIDHAAVRIRDKTTNQIVAKSVVNRYSDADYPNGGMLLRILVCGYFGKDPHNFIKHMELIQSYRKQAHKYKCLKRDAEKAAIQAAAIKNEIEVYDQNYKSNIPNLESDFEPKLRESLEFVLNYNSDPFTIFENGYIWV